MMMILLNYGVELNLPGCLELVQALERMTLRVPQDLLDRWNTMKPAQIPMPQQAPGRADFADRSRAQWPFVDTQGVACIIHKIR